MGDENLIHRKRGKFQRHSNHEFWRGGCSFFLGGLLSYLSSISSAAGDEYSTSGNLQCIRKSIFNRTRIDNPTVAVENANSRSDFSDKR